MRRVSERNIGLFDGPDDLGRRGPILPSGIRRTCEQVPIPEPVDLLRVPRLQMSKAGGVEG